MNQLRSLLAHPLTKGQDIDSAQTTILRRTIIKDNRFLTRLYDEWYQFILAEVGGTEGVFQVLELGSGAGFLVEYLPSVITSDVFFLPFIDMVLDGMALPFAGDSLQAIVMCDVLHHIPDCVAFFAEAERVLQPGGRIVMSEPWLTKWSEPLYRRLHHEPVVRDAEDWVIPATGPLSGANTALPWILFERDRTVFEQRFPTLRVKKIQLHTPFRYLVSGGVSMRQLQPGFMFGAWSWLEQLAQRMNPSIAMFALIVVEKA